MNNLCRNLVAGAIWVLSTVPAQAHDFWIEPDSFTPDVGQPVSIFLRFGVGFSSQTLPYLDTLFNDFSITDKNGRADILSRLGNDPAAIVDAKAGAQLLGYQSTPQFVEMSPEKFNKYIEEEGIEYISAERERRGESHSPALENFIRCAKALIQSSPESSDIYREKLGYTLELIPQTDPYRLKKGESLEFQLLYRDKPIEGLQLQAVPKVDPENVQKVRTNKSGRASVVIDRSGVWLIKAVLILPIEGRQQADTGIRAATLQSYWASYVFELVDG